MHIVLNYFWTACAFHNAGIGIILFIIQQSVPRVDCRLQSQTHCIAAYFTIIQSYISYEILFSYSFYLVLLHSFLLLFSFYYFLSKLFSYYLVIIIFSPSFQLLFSFYFFAVVQFRFYFVIIFATISSWQHHSNHYVFSLIMNITVFALKYSAKYNYCNTSCCHLFAITVITS